MPSERHPNTDEVFTPTLDFTKTVYFMIVTLGTTGFGEIFPVNVISRMYIIFFTLINFIILSNDLGAVSGLYLEEATFKMTVNFKNHLVIVGRFKKNFINNFLNELYSKEYGNKDLKTIIVTDVDLKPYL